MPKEQTANTDASQGQEAQPGQDENMVDIHQASIEDLDAALANAQLEEGAIAASEAEEVLEGNDSTASQNQNLPEGQGEGAQAQSSSAAPGAEPSKPRVYTEDEVQGLLAENAQKKKELDKKELFIQHRGNELGTVRNQLAESNRLLQEERAAKANGLEDRYAENPVQAVKDQKRIEDIDLQLEQNRQKEERAVAVVETQTDFLRHIDTEQISIDDMAEVLLADGVPEQYISLFKANPWEFTTSEALVQMGKRAMDRKVFVQADKDRRLLAKHVLEQNKIIDALKKRPGQVMAQVQKNLSRGPDVTSAQHANPRSGKEIDASQIPNMSTEELDRALAAAMH